MNWVFIIFALNNCLRDVIEGYSSDVTTQKNPDALGSHNVSCATIDDVAAARRSLCPTQCTCSPTNGAEVLTKLTVDCSGATNFTQYQELVQLLSHCVSSLTELTITNTPLTTVPQVVCRLTTIRSLNLNSNQLASLPSSCFTRMHNLTSFSANNNHLTSLQVR